MRKLLLIGLVLVSSVILAQDTTSVTLNYVGGDGLLEFFKLNMWPILIAVFAVFEAYVGGNDNLKSNSTLSLVLNFIKSIAGKLVKK